MSEESPRPRALRVAVPGLFLLAAAAYALLIHHGFGPRPEVPDSALRWWSPRGFLMQELVGSSWESLLNERGKGLLVFGTPSLLLLAGVWATTRSSLARAAAVTLTLAVGLFLFYGLGSGTSQLVWNFFHWRWSGTMLAVAAVVGCAITSPWLAASWLRLGWPLRLVWFLPIIALVLVVERNVTGTNGTLPFAISPWPAVQVFGFEAIDTTLAAEMGGVALGLAGLTLLRRGRRALGVLVLVAGFALPAAWLALGSEGLLPFRVTHDRLLGAAMLCIAMLVIAALGVRLDPIRLRRRAVHAATAAVLLGIPLFVGAAWARWDYSRTREVRARLIIDALDTYYQQNQSYPDELEDLVKAKILPAIPTTAIGFPLVNREEAAFTYQGFGTSYLLEFSAPRWVQCAYNPPYPDEDGDDGEAPDDGVSAGGEDGDASNADSGGGAWSCPSKPPELW